MEQQTHPLPKDALTFINVCLEAARKKPTANAFVADRMATHNGARMMFNIMRAGCIALAMRGAVNVTDESPISGVAQLFAAAALYRYVARDVGSVAEANAYVASFAKKHGMETTIRVLKASRANVSPNELR